MKRALLKVAHRAGVLSGLRRLYGPKSLAVLCYHRIGDHRSGSSRFGPIFSTDASGFAAQLEWITRHYRVVTMSRVADWVIGHGDLPDWPLLITFDDGYRDNAEIAGPLLRERGLPATVFLTTSILDGQDPLWWDVVARCFELTEAVEAELPVIGRIDLSDGPVRRRALAGLIRSLKELPEPEKLAVVEQVVERLGVDGADCRSDSLYLDWETVRAMLSGGFSFGAHTVTHPILTKISSSQVRAELAESKDRIEAETGVPVRALAYPNGQRGDFDGETRRIAAGAGYDVAFTLLPGPARAGEATGDRYAVRRMTIHHKDDPVRFAAKVSGVPRLLRMR